MRAIPASSLRRDASWIDPNSTCSLSGSFSGARARAATFVAAFFASTSATSDAVGALSTCCSAVAGAEREGLAILINTGAGLRSGALLPVVGSSGGELLVVCVGDRTTPAEALPTTDLSAWRARNVITTAAHA
ncbi:hypothetical protein AB1Y20_004062 [Prymnesium parvum]|uniref:Uncharacterized protein n=1 Tax=Prymnesium parvum TaxID=97485 RepID=A0AB34J8T9_PRYPA